MTFEVMAIASPWPNAAAMDPATARRLTAVVGAMYTLVGGAFVVASFHDGLLGAVNAWLVPDRAAPTPAARLYAAVMGAVVVGLGVTLARVSIAAARGPAAVGRALRDGLLAWFVVDTTASLLHGSWQNALFNVLSLSLGLPPILVAVSLQSADARRGGRRARG